MLGRLTIALACCLLLSCRAEPPPGLPEFTDVPAGPRAPADALLEVRVGQTTRAAVDALVNARGVHCQDLSPAVLGAKMRAQRPPDIDASSRASPARAGNPQVRISCGNVAASALLDRPRPAAQGRWLFVFDSPAHPLRHVSYRRRHGDHATAAADLSQTVSTLTERFGPPTSASVLPATFKAFRPYKWEWRFADIRVEASALNYGERGVDVLEAIEVPWPVRSDRASPAP